MERIGILGGSFNPIHKGHIDLAYTVLQELSCEAIYFLPAYVSPFKIGQMSASGQHRCNMIAEAIQEEPRFSLCRVEVDKEEPSYTANTMPKLAAMFPNKELIWIMGADAFLTFGQWYHPEIIAQYASIATVCRDTASIQELKDLSYKYEEQFKTSCYVLGMETNAASSTRIRQDIEIYREDLPPSVYQYIKEHALYAKL